MQIPEYGPYYNLIMSDIMNPIMSDVMLAIGTRTVEQPEPSDRVYDITVLAADRILNDNTLMGG